MLLAVGVPSVVCRGDVEGLQLCQLQGTTSAQVAVLAALVQGTGR